MQYNAPIVLAGSTLISTGLRFVSSIILTRLLAPEAFALIGLVTTVMFVIEMISDFGFRSYLLKHTTVANKSLVANLWIIQIVRGIVLTILTFAIGNLIGLWIPVPGLETGVQIAGFLFLINGFTSFAPFLSEKKGKVIKPIILDLVAAILGIVAVLSLTFAFRSVWAVIIGSLVAPLISMLFSHTCYPTAVRRFSFSWNKSMDFFHWSKYIIPSSIITIFCIQLDKFVLAQTISTSELGLYFTAVSISMLGTRFMMEYARRVLGSQLAVHQNYSNSELASVYYKNKHPILCLAAFGIGILMFYSLPIIDLIYDDRYLGVATFLSVLMLKPALCLWSYPLEAFLITKGMARATLIGNILRLIWISITIPLAIKFGNSLFIVAAFALSEVPVVVYFLFKVNAFEQALSYKKEIAYLLILFSVGAISLL